MKSSRESFVSGENPSFRSVDASFQVQSISRRPSLNRKSRTLHSCPCSEQPMAHYDSLRSRSCEPKIWDMFWCSDADNTSRTSEAFSQTDAHCELTFVYFDYICDVVKSWIVIIWYNMIYHDIPILVINPRITRLYSVAMDSHCRS
jgi:hypothetical protein